MRGLFLIIALILPLFGSIERGVFDGKFFYDVKRDKDSTFLRKRDLENVILKRKIDSEFVRDIKVFGEYLYIVYDYKKAAVLEKIDKSDLKSVFRKVISSDGIDFAFCLYPSKDFVFVTGGTTGNLAKENRGGSDIFLAKFSTRGDEEGIWQFGSEFDEWGREVVFKDGYIFLACERSQKSDPRDIEILKLDENGSLILDKIFSKDGEDLITDMKVSDKIYLYLQNWSNEGNSFSDLYLMSLSLNAKQSQIVGFKNPSIDQPINMQIKDKIYFSFKNLNSFGYVMSKSSFFTAIYKEGLNPVVFPVGEANGGIWMDNNYLYVLGEGIERFKMGDFYEISLIARFYTQFFKRAIKKHEMDYWLNRLKKDFKSAVLVLFHSREFKEKNEDISKYSFIKLLYRALLNREPKRSAIGFWSSFEEERIVKGVLNSKEFSSLMKSF